MQAKAPGGLFIGTNGEYHDANGERVEHGEAEKRIRAHEDTLRKAGIKTDAERLRDEERSLRLRAAEQAAERTGLTGALRAIDRANSDSDANDGSGRASSPAEDREAVVESLSDDAQRASAEDRSQSGRVAATDANVPTTTASTATASPTTGTAEKSDGGKSTKSK